MIDNRTINKNYPLPHPENIASQDVGRIATAIGMIDADVDACENSIEAIQETVQELDAKSLRIPESLVGTVDTELQNLQPRQYIVVNANGTGFTTIEGGGGEGGLMGEVLAKRTNFNFDTMWVDPRAISKKSAVINEIGSDYQLKNNNVVILADDVEIDNGDQLPRVGLTQRQIISDIILDSQYTYILCDEIDESAPDESDIATREKFGRVKVGPGIDLNNGKISHTPPPNASKTIHGLVKIGPGLDVANGIVSAPNYQNADHENFGTVKLSSDFKTGSSGELLLASRKNVGEIIYQTANVDVVQNNCIVVKSHFAKYRIFINEDSIIKFDWTQFVQEKDLAFDLEIISDANYVILFDANVAWKIPCAGVPAGKTIIHFERKFGSTILYGELKEMDKYIASDLTTYPDEDVQENFICGSNGCVSNMSKLFSVQSEIWYDGSFTSRLGEVILYMDFMRSTLVDHVFLWHSWGRSPASEYFYIEGSVDRQNWTKLYTSSGENVIDVDVCLQKRGYFRHYRIRLKNDTAIRGWRWYGCSVDDELFELKKIMPQMTGNSLNGFSITSSGANEGALYNLTDGSVENFANFSRRDENGQYWIKYELPEANVADMIDLGVHRDASERFPIWFKIEASNDNENWTLLLERAQLLMHSGGETVQYYIDNSVAYKFYKFIPIEIPSTEFRIARFRLYRKIEGRESIQKFVPKLTSPTQGGYEVSCSSQLNDHFAYYAFDGNDYSQWATTAGSAQNSWIQIKFPTESICDAVCLKARNDQYYVQAAASFEIQGSNDGTTYRILKTVSTSWNQGEEKIISFFNDVAFLYYRIFVKTVQNSGDHAAFSTINFGTSLREYKRELNVRQNLLPIMNSNSQDGYEVSCGSEYDNDWRIHRAFDRNSGTAWSTAYDSPTARILIAMPEAKICNLISIYPRSGQLHQAFGSFSLFGSSDGENWTELLNVSDIPAWNNNVEKSWTVENDLAFLRYKIIATPIDGGDCVSVSDINLFYKYTTREY